MTTFTTSDREEAERANIEPIPFAGMVDVQKLEEEVRRLRAENEELRYSGKSSSNH